MNKRFGILLLAVLLCFAACGDGGKDTGNAPELTKEVTATPVPEATATPEPTATPGVTEAPEETEVPFVPITATYKVILTEVGPEKVKAIKLYRDLTGAGLAEAKTAVESTPCVLLETLHQSAAEQVRADFEAIGSTITVEYGMIELEEIQDAHKNYVITLLEVGPEKVKVIKVYREASGLGLKEAKDAVESAPCTVIEVTNKVDAELIAAKFTEAGATVEIKELE